MDRCRSHRAAARIRGFLPGFFACLHSFPTFAYAVRYSDAFSSLHTPLYHGFCTCGFTHSSWVCALWIVLLYWDLITLFIFFTARSRSTSAYAIPTRVPALHTLCTHGSDPRLSSCAATSTTYHCTIILWTRSHTALCGYLTVDLTPRSFHSPAILTTRSTTVIFLWMGSCGPRRLQMVLHDHRFLCTCWTSALIDRGIHHLRTVGWSCWFLPDHLFAHRTCSSTARIDIGLPLFCTRSHCYCLAHPRRTVTSHYGDRPHRCSVPDHSLGLHTRSSTRTLHLFPAPQFLRPHSLPGFPLFCTSGPGSLSFSSSGSSPVLLPAG